MWWVSYSDAIYIHRVSCWLSQYVPQRERWWLVPAGITWRTVGTVHVAYCWSFLMMFFIPFLCSVMFMGGYHKQLRGHLVDVTRVQAMYPVVLAIPWCPWSLFDALVGIAVCATCGHYPLSRWCSLCKCSVHTAFAQAVVHTLDLSPGSSFSSHWRMEGLVTSNALWTLTDSGQEAEDRLELAVKITAWG
jgi:hypothetical protein